jgi:2-oxoglutarate dehydrogenase E2 component (dihydrolipoamide succinyltransferase)
VLESLVKVTLPELGESVTEGSIVEWRKQVGQWVGEGETLVDVTTDKVDVEVPATASGVIAALHGAEGETVAVGAVLAEIDTTAAKPDGASAPAPAAVPAAAPAAVSAKPAASAAGPLAGVASHHARRLAERFHLDLTGVKGSGPDGLILREDVEAAMAAGTLTAGPNGSAPTAPPPCPTPPSGRRPRSSRSKVRPRRWRATWTRA